MQIVIGTGRAITNAVLRGMLRGHHPEPEMPSVTHFVSITPKFHKYQVRLTLAWLLVDLHSSKVKGRRFYRTSIYPFTVPALDARNNLTTQNYYAETFAMEGDTPIIIKLRRGPPRLDLLLAVDNYEINTDTMRTATRRIGIDGETKIDVASTIEPVQFLEGV